MPKISAFPPALFESGAGKPGKFGIDLGYRELPYRGFGDTVTPFTGSGDTLNLPASWVPAASTGGMTELSTSLMPHALEMDRQVVDFGANFLPSSRFRLYADYQRQQREGTKMMAGSFFSQSSYLPRAVDDYTDRFDAGVRYSNGPFNIALAYFGSFYTNELSSLTWDNPYTPFPGLTRPNGART